MIRWLRHETKNEVRKKPILPHLYEGLENSEYISREYLVSADTRMKKIAGTIAFLASWHLPKNDDVCRFQAMNTSQNAFICTHLCRFDRKMFFEIGRDIRRYVREKNISSRLIRTESIRDFPKNKIPGM